MAKHFTRRFLLNSGARIAAGLAALAAIPGTASAASGSFSGQGRYKVSGVAKLEGRILTLSGFSSSRGPDVFVHVGNGGPDHRVAKLKSFSGDQSYELPASINPASISSVHIWCRAFGVNMGQANLR
ncbi:MAG: DM13 domain-containing protein [Pseudomonadota bacterium]